MNTEKKLTPLQEAMEVLRKNKFQKPKNKDEIRFNSGMTEAIEHLEELLPKEKEFAREMWTACNEFNHDQHMEQVTDRPATKPDFEEFYKQYEQS